MQQLADDGRDRVGCACCPKGLEVAAGAKRAAGAFDHEHFDVVRRLDLGRECLEPFCDRKVDRVEARRAVERDRRNRAVDSEQRRIGRRNVCFTRNHRQVSVSWINRI